jgi:hypothetical protein
VYPASDGDRDADRRGDEPGLAARKGPPLLLPRRLLHGVGQARNRTPAAVTRTLPLGLIAYSLVIVWYARHAHHTADVVAEHRRRAPWYRTKTQPSFDDMIVLLRRTIIASRFLVLRAAQPDPAKTTDDELTWAYAMG